ncbi:hypothetical protein SAMN05444339_102362 [Loktanella atrilutea]|uniref:TraB family protein n=1 Tax=Loktanella atrilutea TaxID=366533 RepID=A0A1M4X6G1_LOKAT|nr:TraB/GumN family protein [Loktanella atrilutea]SHE89088.1 hypothetical protein SAMN05444339_102362 [Loktanella atrilutea]
MRLILAAIMMVLALPAQALCTGPDIRARLSDADRAAVASAVATMPFAQGLFYRATRDDTAVTVIGTMHIYDPRLDALADRAAPHVAASDLLLVEAGPEEEAALTHAMATDRSLIFLPDGPTLPERLDDTTWQALVSALNARGVPAVIASQMQPWYVGMMLAIPPCAMSELSAGKKGLDGMIVAQAQAADLPVQALEPWQTLFDILRADPLDQQIDQLRLALSPSDLQAEMFASMMDSYFAERIGELWEVSRVAAHLLPDVDRAAADALFTASERQLLFDRNADWITVIDAAAEDHDRLTVAVGAAHLQGIHGLLKLLAQDGWIVTRLP